MYKGDYNAIKRDIKGHSFTDQEIERAMSGVYKSTGYLLDPHGATAYLALKRDVSAEEKGIFLATAHPSKFAESVSRVTGVSFKSTPNPHVHTDCNDTAKISPSLAALKKVLTLST